MKLLKDLQDTSIFSYDIDNDSFAIDDIELSLPYCGKFINLLAYMYYSSNQFNALGYFR